MMENLENGIADSESVQSEGQSRQTTCCGTRLSLRLSGRAPNIRQQQQPPAAVRYAKKNQRILVAWTPWSGYTPPVNKERFSSGISSSAWCSRMRPATSERMHVGCQERGGRQARGASIRVSESRARGSARLQQQPAQAGRLLRGPRARGPLPVGHRHHAQPCPPQQPPLEQRRPVGPPPAAWQHHEVRWPVHLREAERWEGRRRGGERGEGAE